MGTEGILDDTDLRTIRDALAAGKQVKLLPDGSVEASADVVDAPMGAEAEAYIESQLGDVKVLLEQGFEMNLHPAGQVFGASSDGLTRLQGDADRSLGSDDLLTIKVVLGMGANVAVLPDGTVQTRHHLDQTPRTDQEVAGLLAQLDAAVADGSLAAEARAGRGLTIADAGDGAGTLLRFAQAPADAPGIALPDDPVAPAPSPAGGEPGGDNIPDDPTGVDLAGLADRIDARADALRADALEDQVTESSRVGLERDASAREAWMAQQGHEAAWQQARRELKIVQAETKQVADLEARARAAEATRSADHVEDLRQSAAAHQARLDIARQRMESAEAEANRLGQEAAAHRDAVTAAEARLAEIDTRTAERVRFADLLEGQAGQVRSAAESMAAGDVDRARGWLSDARVVGAGEVEPDDLLPDDETGPDAPSPGPITSPSQVDDETGPETPSPGPITSPSQVDDETGPETPSPGPITSPSQVDDVTGAGSPPDAPAPAPATDEAPAETNDQPADQPEDQADQPADQPEEPAASLSDDGLELSLRAADSIEADLAFDGFVDPASTEPEVSIEQDLSIESDAVAEAPAEADDLSLLDG